MKLKKIELNSIKSFEGKINVDFSENTTMFTFSGKNGSGKSTLLKAVLTRSHVARGNAYKNPNYQKHSTSNRPSIPS